MKGSASWDWMSLTALAVSVVALLLSIGTTYWEHWRSFRLDIRSAGRITLSRDPWSPNLTRDALFVDAIFTNTGARRGVVEDVALVVQRAGQKSLFRSFATQRDHTLNLTGELVPPKLEPFVGFDLGRFESTVRRLFFVPHTDASDASWKTFQLGRHTGEIWARSTDKPDWCKHATVTFSIETSDLDQLSSSKAIPQAEGGYFVKFVTQNKVVEESENALQALADRLGLR